MNLGSIYNQNNTTFRLWAPNAENVHLCLYKDGHSASLLERSAMLLKREDDIWELQKSGDLHGVYYTYEVQREGQTFESVDPYGLAVGVNGLRSMVVDLERTNPELFEEDHGPQIDSITDAVIYEMSIADTTGSESAQSDYSGKYLGLEPGKIAFSHIKNLGVTHVQLMPSYDFGSIDESGETDGYNWGYDPLNYFVPEGSYSTNPYDGAVRIREFKTMVQRFHSQGIGVIMDVVFNHTYTVFDNCFYKTSGNHFYRMKDGEYSDASQCGNEIASEKEMVRRYIIDCVCYWAKEYHIDGFRFDLMGILDVDTMNQLAKEVRKVNPQILLYGEGWKASDSPLGDEELSLKKNCGMLDHIGMFSDDIRDHIRGDVFIAKGKGFATGNLSMGRDLSYSIVGSVFHPEIDYEGYSYSRGPWAKAPGDTISYISCHDNLTLWDKIMVTCPEEPEELRQKRNLLAVTIIFTSQGVPFLLQGEEILRHKAMPGSNEPCENSFNIPLSYNAINYDLSELQKETLRYYKDLIALRKAHRGFRLTTQEEIARAVHFLCQGDDGIVSFTITTDEECLLVVYNGNRDERRVSLPDGEWHMLLSTTDAEGKWCCNQVVPGLSACILKRDECM